MGTCYYTYVGPYLKVPRTTTKSLQKIRTCLNVDCSIYKKEINANFCSQCGTKVGIVDIQFTKRLDLSSLEELICEDLENDLCDLCHHVDFYDKTFEYMFLTSNRDIKLGRETNFESNVSYKIEITPELIANEIEIFKQSHNREFELLKKAFDEKSMNFSWGVLGYYC